MAEVEDIEPEEGKSGAPLFPSSGSISSTSAMNVSL